MVACTPAVPRRAKEDNAVRRVLSLRAGLAVAIFLFIVYWTAPVHHVTDSRYSLLLSHSLGVEHTWDLHAYFPALPLNPVTHPGAECCVYPYQTTLVGDRLYYFYPPGGSLLGIPFVALAQLGGVGPVGPGRFDYNGAREVALQQFLAAMLTACWGWLVYQTARAWLPATVAAVVALAAGLGTQAMSTASRALWSDTWGIVMLQVVLLVFVRATRPPSALWLGTMLSWLYFVRPTYNIAVLGVLALIASRRWWRTLAMTSFVGAGWLVGFVVFSQHYYGTNLPPYYLTPLGFGDVSNAFFGHLVSPSRGLFVYVPAAGVVFVILLFVWRQIRDRPLTLVALAMIAAHLMVVSGFHVWWGGHSYGPRLLTGLLPWLVILTVQALAAIAAFSSVRLRRVAITACAVAAVAGVLMNARSVFWHESYAWNVGVDNDPSRLWNWRDPQFLAVLHPR